MSQQVTTSWQHGHYQALGSGENTGGYGGLLRTEHAKRLLREAGHTALVVQHQSQQMMRQPPVPQQPANSTFLRTAANNVLPGTNTARAQPAPKRKVMTIVDVYKGMTHAQISRLTLVEIRKALSTLNEPSWGKYSKTDLERRLLAVLQEKEDGFKFSFEYMK